eukprot:1022212-Amphidinium_carterae.2
MASVGASAPDAVPARVVARAELLVLGVPARVLPPLVQPVAVAMQVLGLVHAAAAAAVPVRWALHGRLWMVHLACLLWPHLPPHQLLLSAWVSCPVKPFVSLRLLAGLRFKTLEALRGLPVSTISVA